MHNVDPSRISRCGNCSYLLVMGLDSRGDQWVHTGTWRPRCDTTDGWATPTVLMQVTVDLVG